MYASDLRVTGPRLLVIPRCRWPWTSGGAVPCLCIPWHPRVMEAWEVIPWHPRVTASAVARKRERIIAWHPCVTTRKREGLGTVEMDTLADKLSFGTLRQSDSLSPVTSASSDVFRDPIVSACYYEISCIQRKHFNKWVFLNVLCAHLYFPSIFI